MIGNGGGGDDGDGVAPSGQRSEDQSVKSRVAK